MYMVLNDAFKPIKVSIKQTYIHCVTDRKQSPTMDQIQMMLFTPMKHKTI